MSDLLSSLVSLSEGPVDVDEGTFPALKSVYASAVSGDARQVTVAENVIDKVRRYPPSKYPKKDLKSYFDDVILGSIPETTRYDDVFWCCFLCLAAAEGTPELLLGGPIHQLVYSAYDDFDPRDVTND